MADITNLLTGVGSVAAPVSSFGSNVFNALMQSRENRLNREWTAHQNDLAWQRQRRLIDEQRAYDTPKAQMQRLMDAGLNPNLIYDDIGGNMQAMNAPNAAGMYQGIAPRVDPLSLSQAILNMSQARKNDSDMKLSKAQANRILKLSNKEFELLSSNVEKLNQSIQSESFNAALSDLKAKWLKSDVPIDYSVYDKDGNVIQSRWIRDSSEAFKSLWQQELKVDLSTKDAQLAVQKLLAELAGAQNYAQKISLENQQLAEFVRVAADIADGQASEAQLLKTISDMDKEFYSSLGSSDRAVSTMVNLLMTILRVFNR